jgi:DNA-binding beta-propeller fold protein YncE
MKLDNDGNILHTIAVGYSQAGVAIDKSGNIWVANSRSNTVTKITQPAIPATTKSPTSSPTTKSPAKKKKKHG